MRFSWFALLSFVVWSCNEKPAMRLFELVENTGIDFNNKVVDGQVENSFYYRNYYNGGGVALGDINNDGLCDVLLTSNMDENKLFLNKGAWKFQDITPNSGFRQDSMWSTGATMVDINHDGWLDIYVCNSGNMKSGNRRNKLYINNRNLTFTERAKDFGLDISGYSTHVSFFDYDLDGDLDCFMINNSPMPFNNLGYTNRRDLPDAQWPVADFLKGGGDHLFRNDSGKFTEVSQQAGIHGTLISFGLGVSVGDINMDGYPDVYVANDSYERDYLYINQKDGTFKDEMETWAAQNSFSSMGADLADVNNDGLMDAFTTDMLPDDDYRLKTLGAFDNIDLYNTRIKIGFYRQFMKNCLFINDGNGRFIETANYSGVSASDWSWGALFFDADNDGNNDVFVCNGVNRDVTNLDFMDFFANDVVQNMVVSGQKQSVDSVLSHIPVYALPNKTFRNLGNLRFSDEGQAWGLDQKSFSNGAAYADLDNDGDLDLVVNNQNQPSFIYRNNSRELNGNSSISILLEGDSANRYAIGSKIRVYNDSAIYYRELIPSRGFQSSVDYRQVIGLGKLSSVDSLVIVWPDGQSSVYLDPKLNELHKIKIPPDRRQWFLPVAPAAVLFDTVAVPFEPHLENEYIDFYYERNLPELLSREGPHIAKADVNGDGLEDIYIGGGKGQTGQLYLQSGNDKWTVKVNVDFETYKSFEDVAVLFFDADKDGDPDLFVGAGGNELEPGSRELQHRLFLNDGKGNFKLDPAAFPVNDMNISVAANYDYDGDGDEDLFVGSRSMPFNYGVTPASYLYKNDGKGHFSDVTATAGKDIQYTGMVTGAAWENLLGDGNKELIIVGEWMSPKIFAWNKTTSTFELQKSNGLENLSGWWQTIQVSDLTGDGHKDLVIGNIGENFYLRPDKDHPVNIWLADFDNNGNIDQFLTRTLADKRKVPVFLKREITDQFPALKKENLKHSEYAVKSVQDLFTEAVIKNATTRVFNYSQSIIAINDGKGNFRISPLPALTQLSSINAIVVTDVNGDQLPDIVAGGNKFTFPPQFGRLDASFGHVMLNQGNGKFAVLANAASGIMMLGEVRDIAIINNKDKRMLLFVRNNEKPILYKLRKSL